MRSPSRPLRMIVDTDAGVDDISALMLALSESQVTVGAITTVAGNVPVSQATQNVSLVLDVFGREVPVYEGASCSLMGGVLDATDIMGPDGLGGVTAWMQPSMRQVKGEVAAGAMPRLLRSAIGEDETVIVALGPLTNLALALGLDVELPRYVSRLVVMGGTAEARGNASAVAEFNFFADPEAASVVLRAGFSEIWLLPWETAVKHPIPWDVLETLFAIKSPRAQFFAQMCRFLQQRLAAMGLPGLVLPDFLAMLVALHPEVVREAPAVHAEVETEGRLGRGMLAISWYRPDLFPNLRLVLDLDIRPGIEALRSALEKY